ncbi:inovirus Gp2 family protein [Psychromonas arctica]|uniref:inovirus Gp2 family protein n=1 Tax=Psychromonas arctica TaxID=168275 RepID=UPI000427E8B3|nr:inovirus Gp2 family protein [Psychromonas arctica]
MSKHPINKNLNIIKASTFENLPLGKPKIQGTYRFIEEYLNSNINVMDDALHTHARTLAVRVDLHIPTLLDRSLNNLQEAIITRFIKSLKSKVESHIARTARGGRRVHYSGVKYIWVCERGKSNKDHYHLMLFLSSDTFRYPIFKSSLKSSHLAIMIVEAWQSALRVDFETAWHLVTIPSKGSYSLCNTPSPKDDLTYCAVFKHLSYFAKVKTKAYGENRNSYGCSRLPRF